ncbi:MAG TPA: hypothetical protein VFF73_38085 [Planctomycetota bacterium]|nr:hypothetical protein [Planctomycetota bacterium]
MMDCDTFEELTLLGEENLSADQRKELDQHAAGCEDCRRLRAANEAFDVALREAASAPSSAIRLTPALEAAVTATIAKRGQERAWARARKAKIVLGSLLVLVITFGGGLGFDRSALQPGIDPMDEVARLEPGDEVRAAEILYERGYRRLPKVLCEDALGRKDRPPLPPPWVERAKKILR